MIRPRHPSAPGDLPPEFGLDDADDAWMDRASEAEMPESLGSIGPYQVLEEIRRGGQGAVYRARQRSLNRDVALKRLVAGSLATTEMRDRFRREVEMAASLDHPGVVSVFGYEVVDGQPIIAMEWVDGEPIDEFATRIRATDRDHEHLLRVFDAVCDAVSHAHQRGVIHRDLKPSNILVDRRGTPRVLDFGLATPADPASRLTMTSAFVGSPAYAAPEQLRGRHASIDARTDVFALGACLYELLGGTAAFGRPDDPLVEVLRAVEQDDPPPLTADPGLRAIVDKTLAKDPADRYASVDALRADLQRYRRRQPVEAHAPSRWYAARQFARRHRAVMAVGGVVATLLVGLSITSMWIAVRLHTEQERMLATFFDGFAAAAAGHEVGDDPAIVETLDLVGARVEQGALHHDSPEAEARVRQMICEAFVRLQDQPRAERHLRNAVAFYERHPALRPNAHGWCLWMLGNFRYVAGDPDGLTLLRDAYEHLRLHNPADSFHVRRCGIDLARAIRGLDTQPDLDLCAELTAAAIDYFERHPDPRYPYHLATCYRLAAQFAEADGETRRAIGLAEQSLAVYREMGAPRRFTSTIERELERYRATTTPR